MTEVLKIIIVALACPLVLPLVVEAERKDHD